MYSILIIDSNREAAGQTREFLKNEGYKVFYSENGINGIHKAMDKKPDLI